MLEQKNNKSCSVKLLKMAFKKYSPDKQKQMKKDYELLIRNIRQPANSEETFVVYKNIVKKLSAEDKVIVFHDVEVQLSKQQFIYIRLLIQEGSLDKTEYLELNFSNNFSERKYANNMKSFVSKLHNKIYREIKRQKTAYFKDKNDIFIKKNIKELIRYELNALDYSLYSSYKNPKK